MNRFGRGTLAVTITTEERRLFSIAGWLLIGYIALTFAGVGLEESLTLGEGTRAASAALVGSSMTKDFTGGYIEFVRHPGLPRRGPAPCPAAARRRPDRRVVLVVHLGERRGCGRPSTSRWGSPPARQRIYDGHHGASLATVTAVNDVRNFAFFLSAGLSAVLALGVAASVLLTRRLPRGVAYSGILVAVVYLAAIPAARTGAIDLASLLGFGWLAAVAVHLPAARPPPGGGCSRTPGPAQACEVAVRQPEWEHHGEHGPGPAGEGDGRGSRRGRHRHGGRPGGFPVDRDRGRPIDRPGRAERRCHRRVRDRRRGRRRRPAGQPGRLVDARRRCCWSLGSARSTSPITASSPIRAASRARRRSRSPARRCARSAGTWSPSASRCSSPTAASRARGGGGCP